MLRVGISILSTEGRNVWNSGIDQNVYFLASLLDGIPFVDRVLLLDCGDQHRAPDDAGSFADRFPIVQLREADDLVDVVIELAGGLEREWCARFRARGGKIATHLCGHVYAPFVAQTIFDHRTYFSAEPRDEIWILAKDQQFRAMLRAIHRCPVFETPYLWAPDFLDESAATMASQGLSFGYRPGSLSAGGAVPAIFEPNISPMKVGIIPFLICEEMQRADPHALARVHFMNTAHMKNHHTLVSLVGNSDLYKVGKVRIEARDYFTKVMGGGANLVVSHQITWSQNYLYLDALHGNYPLIHNSTLFSDAGYYYPDSDVPAGVEQLRLAIADHDHNLDSYAARAAAKIASLSPDNRVNRDAYARRLLALVEPSRRNRVA
ncbi:MAG TPA: DUF2827 family protein [Phenylobacterium sp.]